MKIKQLFTSFLLLSICWACSKSGVEVEGNPNLDAKTKDRQAMLTYTVDSIVLPAYLTYQLSFDSLKQAYANFASAPSDVTLSELQEKFGNSYVAWQTVELFDFGPGEKYTIRFFHNIYPCTESAIKQYIASETPPNLEQTNTFSAQGYPALDYLVNGIAPNQAAILAYYQGADAAKTLAYIDLVLKHMDSLLKQVISDWQGTAKAEFIKRSGTDIGSSFSQLVNASVLHYERYMRSGKIGIPSGAMLNGITAPQNVEAFYSKTKSKVLLLKAHQAYVDFFNGVAIYSGNQGPSLRSYLNGIGAKDLTTSVFLSEIINTQFEKVGQSFSLLSDNFSNEISTNPSKLKASFAEMQKAVSLLKVDMTSALTVTITYTDNDGD